MKKTKVLHIVSSLDCGGAETMIMNIYRNIDRKKIQFDFLCLNPKNGGYDDEVKKRGGHIYRVLPTKNKLKELYTILKEQHYDVVHSHVMFYSGFIQIISKIAGVKIRITHSHSSSDIKEETIFRKMYIWIMRILINLFSNVKISCGEEAGKYLYGKKEKYIILKNGIDIEKFCNVTIEEIKMLKKELKIEDDSLIIGHVGRFSEEKNQDYFIELAKEMIKKEKKFKIVLVGQGERFEYIKKLIEKEEINNYFVMPGLRKDINVFMKMFDIFIMPSLYEGFPLVVVEALAGDNICYLSENIPKETKIINSRVYFFDLKDSKNKLVKDIYEKINNKCLVEVRKELTNQGFSIKNMVKEISQIYLSNN